MIPQADESDDSAVSGNEFVDYRSYFSRQLNGNGLEIGGLNSPMPKHEGMNVTYVDQVPLARLREQYPEFSHIDLVAPDFIDDAQTLASVDDTTYDFVIASHVIEHLTDPIGAIKQWCRVLKPGGLIYLVTPDKRKIFDRFRPRTLLSHLVSDYWYSGEYEREQLDWHHFVEYVDLVDNRHFGNARSPSQIVDHAKQVQDACYSIHLHCFLPIDMTNMLNWINENVVGIEVLSGPVMYKDECEFHCLIKKI